ncbi:tetratricopeptide repeat protein [Lignipirellula cremea]|uniref:Tetratricopeptide repeat protein n=1 Tax=Lignipirellula cremea TaxID=2528010 RepID=A0A518DSF3_9BACT|nr:tetratricopeptide repeat protein [Lignipirellula cremea]QDU94767.1 Tetratricopeptide repeat protein [Lignipirellula cremea]
MLLLLSCSGCAALMKPLNMGKPIDPAKRTEQVLNDFEKQRNHAQLTAAASRFDQGDAPGALSLVEDLLERKPDDPAALSLLADLCMVEGRNEEAIVHRRKLAEASPDDAEQHHQLAMLLESCDRIGEALPHFEKAVQLDPHNTLYRETRDAALENQAVNSASGATASRTAAAGKQD